MLRSDGYSPLSIVLHWLAAIFVVALFLIRLTRNRSDLISLTAAGLRTAPARSRRIRGGPRSQPVASPSKTDSP